VNGGEIDDDIRRATRVLEESLREERGRVGGGTDTRRTGKKLAKALERSIKSEGRIGKN